MLLRLTGMSSERPTLHAVKVRMCLPGKIGVFGTYAGRSGNWEDESMVNHVYSSPLISNSLLYLPREGNHELQFNSWNRLNEHDVNHDSAFFLISKNLLFPGLAHLINHRLKLFSMFKVGRYGWAYFDQ